MTAILDYMRLCRLCLVKDKVNVPIFGEASEVRQIFLKITACLPVKVSEEDNLPKHICDSCMYKVDLLYQFWNTTVNAEKQLIQWLGEIGVDVNIKNTSPPNLRITPQSHAHPHSMPEAIILKEERPDPEMRAMETSQNYQDSQNMYSDYEMPYQPQVNMTVGAPTDFSQPTDAPAEEEVKVPQQKAQPTKPTPAKRRGRPPKQKTPPAVKVTPPPAPPAATSTATTATGSKRRSSAAAAAAAVAAAAAANASSDESDMDDRYGDDSDDEDMDVRIAKEEADSEDEEYIDNPESLEPTAFVGVPSTSACDSEQPGPSGLGGSTTTGKTSTALPASAANESGTSKIGMKWSQDPLKVGAISKDTDSKPLNTFCSICNRDFANRRLYTRHNRRHKPKVHACKMCGRKLRYLYQLKIHESLHGPSLDLPCDLCGKTYSTEELLISHKKRVHNRQYSLFCEDCGRGFFFLSELNHHRNIQHLGKRFACTLCDKSYRTREYLNAHTKTHDLDYVKEQFKCEHCDKVYETVKSYKRHIKAIHEKIPIDIYMCDMCGKKVTSANSLRDHKMMHTGDKPYKCPTCQKGFNTQKYLTVHLRVHTKEKPYVCDECGKCFTQPSPLKLHRRLHSGERPYPCNICEKRFVSKSSLKLHAKIHGVALADINK